jgi:hypothetical protein
MRFCWRERRGMRLVGLIDGSEAYYGERAGRIGWLAEC